MWYGKDTEELKQLNKEYKEMFGGYPWELMNMKNMCVISGKRSGRERNFQKL